MNQLTRPVIDIARKVFFSFFSFLSLNSRNSIRNRLVITSWTHLFFFIQIFEPPFPSPQGLIVLCFSIFFFFEVCQPCALQVVVEKTENRDAQLGQSPSM